MQCIWKVISSVFKPEMYQHQGGLENEHRGEENEGGNSGSRERQRVSESHPS